MPKKTLSFALISQVFKSEKTATFETRGGGPGRGQKSAKKVSCII